ncbi:hypothetical protein V0U79_11485 [Hyphobacterium sp. HN65]|uniref:Porin domain-containing protein n=1 Tax=Hyphobacterium lacteum TaxID=3116575 RepID=A0ABU7LSX4_9PROT|nr:hypothetical protein [Hyphobacterium sp. HN65]MEE2526993.1 hypothetical protein [Hyphobacterium sp. HN65]
MMLRISGAIIFSALSVVLAAAPAHSFQNNSDFSEAFAAVEFRFSADAALVFAAGDYGGSTLADLDMRFEWEGISDNGWRWGAELGLHAQADSAREGFANQAGLTVPPQRSLTTGRYNGGVPETRQRAVAASQAALFLKTSWGDWRAGLTPGAAAAETVPMPTGSAYVRLDGGPLSPSYGAAIRTLNAASGLGPSLIYTSPRIVGLRASVSFTPETAYCAIDFCRSNETLPQLASSHLENLFEAGLSFDHTFIEAGRVRLGVNLVRAEPRSVRFAEDYQAVGLQARWSREDWHAGISALWSDNAVSNGGYEAVMAAVRRDAGLWSVGLEWAQASDDLLMETQDAYQLTVSRLVGEDFSVAFGLHEVDTEFTQFGPLVTGNSARNGTGAFLELVFNH